MNRFEAWLVTTDLGVTVKEFPQGTRTATEAARAVGCELGQIVKSLVFMTGASPVIALMSGLNRLDEARLAALVGGPVGKADAETARARPDRQIARLHDRRQPGDRADERTEPARRGSSRGARRRTGRQGGRRDCPSSARSSNRSSS